MGGRRIRVSVCALSGRLMCDVWTTPCRYAVRESSSKITIFKNFKEKKSFKPEFGAEHIFGGHLLGVKESNSLAFFDWESLELVRRIEISVKHVRRGCM